MYNMCVPKKNVGVNLKRHVHSQKTMKRNLETTLLDTYERNGGKFDGASSDEEADDGEEEEVDDDGNDCDDVF